MKKQCYLLLLPVFFFFHTAVSAQQPAAPVPEPSMKYGKPSDAELSMTSYAPDTSAAAVVLYKKCDVNYEFVSGTIQVAYVYEAKIKVLKPEGTSYANIRIPYYLDESNLSRKEQLSQIDASAYNLENGKTVRTKMKRDLIVKERLNKKVMQVKFTVPAVKAGTVFEYRYKLTSDFYASLNNWEAQENIPVIFAQYDMTVPEYFKFNVDMHGLEQLQQSEKKETLTISFGPGYDKLQCSARHLTFTGRQLPGLKGDSYVWCTDDYRSQVNFELMALTIPGAVYETFTHRWEEVDEELLKSDDFGDWLNMRNPFRDEMASLGLDRLPGKKERIETLFKFLKKRISWNGQYGLYGNETKNAIKNGTGTNAEINFVLLSLFRDAELPAFPVLLSRRNLGNLPYAHPSLEKINTFVVAVADTDSSFAFIDGSVGRGYLNVLPPVLQVNRARLLTPGPGEKWIDLSRLGKNGIRGAIQAVVAADGTIRGTRTAAYEGQEAVQIRSRYAAAKDSAEYIGKLETDEEIRVTDYRLDQRDAFSPQVRETLAFEKQATVNGALIYLNPMIFVQIDKCPFIQESRILPVELPYPTQTSLSVALTLPEGYAVEELPKPMIIKIDGGQGYCQYTVTQQGNRVMLRYTFGMDKLMFLPTEYPDLKAFWEAVAEKNNETLVLKKI